MTLVVNEVVQSSAARSAVRRGSCSVEVEDACAKRRMVDLRDVRRVSKNMRETRCWLEIFAAEERFAEWTSCVGPPACSQQVSSSDTTKEASKFSLHCLNFLVPSTIH